MPLTLQEITLSDSPVWGARKVNFVHYNPNNHNVLAVGLHGGSGGITNWLVQTGAIDAISSGALKAGILYLQAADYDCDPADLGKASCINSELQRLPDLSDKTGAHNWADGRRVTFTNENGYAGFDDNYYIAQMILRFTVTLALYPPGNVLVFGGSNGGNMAQKFAIENRSLIAAVQAVASTRPIDYWPPVEPGETPMSFEHGGLDPLNGLLGTNRNGAYTVPCHYQERFWMRQNGILMGTPADIVTLDPDTDPADGCRSRLYEWTGKKYRRGRIDNGGHTYTQPKQVRDINLFDGRPGLQCRDLQSLVRFVEWGKQFCAVTPT